MPPTTFGSREREASIDATRVDVPQPRLAGDADQIGSPDYDQAAAGSGDKGPKRRRCDGTRVRCESVHGCDFAESHVHFKSKNPPFVAFP